MHHHYLSIVVYFLDLTLVPRQILIGFPFVADGCSTAVSYLDIISQVLDEWGLSFRDFNLFVSDGANVMKKLARLMQEINPHLCWLWCVAHRLQLCLKKARDANQSTHEFIERMFRVMNICRRCQASRIEFFKAQDEAGLPQLTMKYRNITRWTTTHDGCVFFKKRYDQMRSGFDVYNGASATAKVNMQKDVEEEINRHLGKEEDEEDRPPTTDRPIFMQDDDKSRLDNIVMILDGYYSATKQLQSTPETWPFQLSGAVLLMNQTIDHLTRAVVKLERGTASDKIGRSNEIAFAKCLLSNTKKLKDELMENMLVVDSFMFDTRLTNPSHENISANRLLDRIKINCVQQPGSLPTASRFRDVDLEVITPALVERNERHATRSSGSQSVAQSDDYDTNPVRERGDQDMIDHNYGILDGNYEELYRPSSSSSSFSSFPTEANDPNQEFLFDSDMNIPNALTEEEAIQSINFSVSLFERPPLVPPSMQVNRVLSYTSENEDNSAKQPDFESPSKILSVHPDKYSVLKKKKVLGPQSKAKQLRCVKNCLELVAENPFESPLAFWKDHIYSNPAAYSFLLTFAAAPCTSCVNERIFAIAGHICIPIRSRLSHVTIQRLAKLSVNMDEFQMLLNS